MSDTFAKLFNVGGPGRQLLVYRERDEDQDATVMHHVTVVDGVRADLKVDIFGERQDEKAIYYLKKFDKKTAKNTFSYLYGVIESGEL